MTAKTKRIIGWALLGSLMLGVIFGIPYGFHLFLPETVIVLAWYLVSLQALGVLGGIAVFVGIIWGTIYLINSED